MPMMKFALFSGYCSDYLRMVISIYKGGEVVAFSYARLWRLLRKRGMSRTDLRKAAGFGTSTLAEMGKDEYVSMETLSKICRVLSCDIGDIIEWFEENEPS